VPLQHFCDSVTLISACIIIIIIIINYNNEDLETQPRQFLPVGRFSSAKLTPRRVVPGTKPPGHYVLLKKFSGHFSVKDSL